MLQSLRVYSRHPIAKIFLGLVLIAFAGLGLGSFVPSLQFNRDYISAGKTSIGIQEIANQFNKLRAEVAPNLTINEAIQNGYLDLLITFLSNEAILLEEANTWGIKVTRDQLKKSLLENKLFLDENGKFSSSKFQTSLLRGGVSEENYLELLGRNLIKQQLTETVSESAKISDEVINLIASHNLEKRDGTIINVNLFPTSEIDAPSDEELRIFFDNTSSSWIEPSRRIGKYITLDPKDFLNDIEISEQELIDEFDIRRSDYIKEETRSINQMVFDSKLEAEKLLSEISQGNEFDKLAKNQFNGKDTIIKDIKKSELIKEISNVVFDMNLNEISQIIETDFGYHIIKLQEINKSIAPKYEEIKNKLKNDIKMERSTDLIYDLANFADDAFASGSSIEDVAKQKMLKVYFSEPLDENGFNDLKQIPENKLFKDKIFLEILWSDLNNDQLSINETEDGIFFALEVDKEIKEFLPKFNDIHLDLKKSWLQTKAVEKTLTQAGELSASNNLIKFAKNKNMQISEVKGLAVNDTAYSRPQIIKTLFNIKKLGENQISADEKGISVVRFDKSIPASKDEVDNLSKVLAGPFNQSIQSDITFALISKLGEKHKLEVNKSLILQALGLTSP